MLGKARIRSGALIAGLALAMLLPATASAATPITFNLTIGFFCVQGNATPNAPVALTWKSATGTVKAKTTVTAANDGRWEQCNEDTETPVVEIGDSIKASDGSSTRTLVVPNLTVIQNRSTDSYHGRGPAGQIIKVHCPNRLGQFEPCMTTWKVRVSSDGRWSLRHRNVYGDDSVLVNWKSPSGDVVWNSSTAPYVLVTVGRAVVTGKVNGATAHVEVRNGTTDAVLGSMEAGRDVNGYFAGKLQNARGRNVRVQIGERIVSDIATDADFNVFQIDASADSATDHITGHCDFDASGVYLIRVYRDGLQTDATDGFVNEDSSFDNDDLSFNSTDKVVVECQVAATGDFVQVWATVH